MLISKIPLYYVFGIAGAGTVRPIRPTAAAGDLALVATPTAVTVLVAIGVRR